MYCCTYATDDWNCETQKLCNCKFWQDIAMEHSVLQELCKDAELAAEIQARLEAAGREDGLKGFEIVKRVLLYEEGFSVENDLMTPSFKLKRPQLKTKFKNAINEMYASLP